jgi:CRP/FNR family transcriptional regulator, nitrogen fixation regulation protein
MIDPTSWDYTVSHEVSRNVSTSERRCSPLERIDSVAAIMRCSRGQEICRQDDPATHWYRVVSGLTRKCALLADGRRRIVDFLLPGDFFGCSPWGVYHFTVEAVVGRTIVAGYPLRRIEVLTESEPEVGRWMLQMAFLAASRLEARILLLGRITAREKVGAFLLEMAKRLSANFSEGVVLPMSRYDIADYLALSAETVSRALTNLEQSSAIQLVGIHRVRIVDRPALEHLSGDYGQG